MVCVQNERKFYSGSAMMRIQKKAIIKNKKRERKTSFICILYSSYFLLLFFSEIKSKRFGTSEESRDARGRLMACVCFMYMVGWMVE